MALLIDFWPVIMSIGMAPSTYVKVAPCSRTDRQNPDAENRGSTTSGQPPIRHISAAHCGSM